MSARVVVVGAGIGGLSSALELKARGFDVTLVEHQDRPGGKMREVETAGGGIDSGPTVFTMRWVFDALLIVNTVGPESRSKRPVAASIPVRPCSRCAGYSMRCSASWIPGWKSW